MKNIIIMSGILVILFSAIFAYGRPLKLHDKQLDRFGNYGVFDDNFDRMIRREMENFRKRFGTSGFDRLMDMKLFDNSLQGKGASSVGAILADSYVKEGKFYINCELPGMNKEDVKIYFSGDSLVIEGEKKSDLTKEDKEKNYYLREISYGKVSRMFTIPENADRESIKASFDDGILTVTMKLTEANKEKIDYIPIE